MADRDDLGWQRQSSEVLSGLREWTEQHPDATFAEMERETMRRMAELQARIMEDIARTMGAEEEQEEVICPECGAKTRWRSEGERRLQGQGGQEVMLRRHYAVCPKCGYGFFPPG